jgi:predicted acetylornithine/succinylornithine family transaminase
MNDLLIEREAKVLLGTYKRQPVVFERGEGSYLVDTNGKRYLDLLAGIAVCTLGHANPALAAAISQQAATLLHTSNLYYTRPMVELAEKLVAVSGMDRVFFCNSGTEANEAAIKIARKWGKQKRGDGCHRIVTFERGFHGRTMGALSATAQRKYCEPFEPLVPGFVQIGPHELERLESLMDGTVCAVMVEPIQGEGGVWPVAASDLQKLRRLCDERGALLIFDEVQTGIGRTGTWFAFQQAGVFPDLMPLAKGLGGGFPIGACLARGEAATTLVPGDHGSTFAGNPLASKVALTVLNEIERLKLLEHCAARGRELRSELQRLQSDFPVIKEVRGMGLMLGVELHEPIARQLVSEGLSIGLVLNATGDTTLRLLPALTISAVEVAEAGVKFRELLGLSRASA